MKRWEFFVCVFTAHQERILEPAAASKWMVMRLLFRMQLTTLCEKLTTLATFSSKGECPLSANVT